jgi:hypothetical protein
MSKYNLIDIFEQYQIGSGWTNDFDYDGMLKTGLGTSIDTPIEVLKKMSDDFEDVNYHRENSHLQYAIDAIEIGDMMEAEGRLSDFHAEIRKTQEAQGMDTSDDLGAYMASKMEENTEAVDLAIEASQEKAGIKEEIAEARVDRDVAERIEGMLSIPLKRKFLDAFMDLWQDLIEEDPFYAEDVINHLNNEMHREIAGWEATGDRLAGIGEETVNEGDSTPSTKDIIKALKAANAQDSEIKQYMTSVKKAGDEFDDVDDYVEDFKNYVADKGLQEHFGRFMKDYQ